MSGCGIKNTVTIVTHRYRSFGGVQGDLFKGQPCWGGNPQLPGQRPIAPEGSAIASFDGRRLSKVLLRYS